MYYFCKKAAGWCKHRGVIWKSFSAIPFYLLGFFSLDPFSVISYLGEQHNQALFSIPSFPSGQWIIFLDCTAVSNYLQEKYINKYTLCLHCVGTASVLVGWNTCILETYSIAGTVESEFSLQKKNVFCELLQKWHAPRAEKDQRSHRGICRSGS